MIDHTGVEVTDYAKSTAFYDAAFGAVGGGSRLRSLCHEDHYGAFVIDLAGDNADAVSHRPE